MYIALCILGVLVGLIGCVLLIALFSAKGYDIRRDIVIDQPAASIYDYLRIVGNHDNFNVWMKRDPNMQETLTGTDGTVGFVYGWSGNKDAGEGEKEIMELVQDRKVRIEMRFRKPMNVVSQTLYLTDPVGTDSTKVTAGVICTLKYPINAILIFVNMDKHLGKGLSDSLVELKRILER